MFTKKHYINVISLMLLSVVTFVNVYKLSLFFIETPVLVGLLYIAIFLSFFFIVDKNSSNEKIQEIKKYFPAILTIYVLLPYLLLANFTSKINPFGRWAETEILIYVVLASAVIISAVKLIDSNKYNLWFFVYPILFGLILSANFYFGFVIILAILFILRQSFPKIFLFSLLTIAFGIAIPKIFGAVHFDFNYDIFLPQISTWFVIVLVVISIYTGWLVADLPELFFASGIVLFIYMLIPAISKILQLGFYNAVKNDLVFSALLAVVPLFLFSIKEYEVDKFLGKVYNDAG